jgi:hypothetical protein
MNTIILMILSSLWAILIVEDFKLYRQLLNYIGIGEHRTIFSLIKPIDFVIDTIHKLLNCPLCLSAHAFWITYLILTGSFIGFILCPIPYFLTFLFKKYIINNNI